MTRSQIDRGFDLLNRVVTPAAADSVRYTRGATVISDALPAALSAPQIQLVMEGGVAIVGRQFKWSLKRSELLWEGAVDRPRRNDRIEWLRDGRIYAFEVLPETGGSESAAVDPRNDWIPATVQLLGVTDE